MCRYSRNEKLDSFEEETNGYLTPPKNGAEYDKNIGEEYYFTISHPSCERCIG